MKQVIIARFPSEANQTLGIIKAFADEGKKVEIFKAKTLELPWKNNQNRISCIPLGFYICRWTYSKGLKKETYEVQAVPKRAGIRIHSGNFHRQILGCILLGSQHKDINFDAELDIIHSGATIKLFNEIMMKQDFQLQII